MKKISALFIIAFLFIFISCTKTNNGNSDVTKTVTLPANGPAVIEANNTFGIKFLQATLGQDKSDNNKLVSPLSIYLALCMVYNGADNATKDSMTAALQLAGIDIADVNATCKAIVDQLPGEDNKVTLSIANSIWHKSTGLQPLQAFLNSTTNYFDATVNPLTTADVINKWVNDKTNGKIEKVINNISPDDLMYLINAIYFKGGWQYGFKAENTHNTNFYLANGNTVNTPFMQQDATFNVSNFGGYRAVELPYGGGKSYSMYLVDGNGQPINELVANLNTSSIKNLISSMTPSKVTVTIPKWEFSYSVDNMRPELASLGMDITFTEGADFSKMYDAPNVAITKAIHKTYIKVDEEGTTAAAVTGIGMGTTAIGPSPQLTFDHPFVFIIAEKQTGAILFTGILNDPSAK